MNFFIALGSRCSRVLNEPKFLPTVVSRQKQNRAQSKAVSLYELGALQDNFKILKRYISTIIKMR